MIYTLYTRGQCSECEAAKRYLRENDVEYKEVYLLTDNDIKEIKSFLPEEIASGRVSLPIVFDSHHEYIGGKIEMIKDHQHNLASTFKRSDLYQILKEHVCQVIFTKVDGTERKMRCTLVADRLPELQKPLTETAKRPVAENFLAVYDLDNMGWRGFRVDSVKSIIVTGE